METFEHTYQEHFPMIHRLAAGIVRDEWLIQDLVQEVFVKFYLQLKAGEKIDFPKTWLYKVALRDSLNLLEKQRRTDPLDNVQHFAIDNGDLIETKLEEQENKLQIQHAIGLLKDNERALILLYSEGLSYKEISEISGVKLNSVGKLLSRALEKLKQIIKNGKYEMSY